MITLNELTLKADVATETLPASLTVKDVRHTRSGCSNTGRRSVKLMASEKKLTDKISRLQDELDKKNRILSSIYKISQKLNRTSDSAQLLKTISDVRLGICI